MSTLVHISVFPHPFKLPPIDHRMGDSNLPNKWMEHRYKGLMFFYSYKLLPLSKSNLKGFKQRAKTKYLSILIGTNQGYLFSIHGKYIYLSFWKDGEGQRLKNLSK